MTTTTWTDPIELLLAVGDVEAAARLLARYEPARAPRRRLACDRRRTRRRARRRGARGHRRRPGGTRAGRRPRRPTHVPVRARPGAARPRDACSVSSAAPCCARDSRPGARRVRAARRRAVGGASPGRAAPGQRPAASGRRAHGGRAPRRRARSNRIPQQGDRCPAGRRGRDGRGSPFARLPQARGPVPHRSSGRTSNDAGSSRPRCRGFADVPAGGRRSVGAPDQEGDDDRHAGCPDAAADRAGLRHVHERRGHADLPRRLRPRGSSRGCWTGLEPAPSSRLPRAHTSARCTGCSVAVRPRAAPPQPQGWALTPLGSAASEFASRVARGPRPPSASSVARSRRGGGMSFSHGCTAFEYLAEHSDEAADFDAS